MLDGDDAFSDIESFDRSGAVLPIGAHEQHGRHLALCTDTVAAGALARSVAQAFGWYLLPALPFGTSCEHMSFPGTVALSAATLAAVLGDIVASLRAHGFRKLAVVSGHGGNWVLKPVVRELNLAHPEGPRIVLADPEVFYYPLVDRPGFHHGGEYETALMLHLHPAGVRMERATGAGAEPAFSRALLDCVPLRRLLPGGAWGAPERATATDGARWAAQAGAACVAYVGETFAALDALDAAERRGTAP
jgi:creatinine amidohydrolase